MIKGSLMPDLGEAPVLVSPRFRLTCLHLSFSIPYLVKYCLLTSALTLTLTTSSVLSGKAGYLGEG